MRKPPVPSPRLPFAPVVLVVLVALLALGVPSAARAQATLPEPSFAALRTPPPGLPPMPLPEPAPTEAQFELGRRLFADQILSIDRSTSCRSCHPPENGYASPEPRPAGAQGHRARAHAPTIVNRGWGRSMRWDGSTPTLEQFVLQPIADPDEMALPLDAALERLRNDKELAPAFTAAFHDGVTDANLAQALATFVRGITAGDAPVDRFLRGQPDALQRDQRAGLWLFESKGGCWRCHPAPLFTDEQFHATGVGAVDGEPVEGRRKHTHADEDLGRFKTPTLRAISATAPYMHDGSLKTLEEVVDFYDRGGNQNRNLDAALKPLALSAQEKQNLVAFLKSL